MKKNFLSFLSQPVQEELSFADKFSGIKSVFIKAHQDALQLAKEMDNEITTKEAVIINIQEEIKTIETTKSTVSKFISNLVGLI